MKEYNVGVIDKGEIQQMNFDGKRVFYSIDFEDNILKLKGSDKIEYDGGRLSCSRNIFITAEDGRKYSFYRCSIRHFKQPEFDCTISFGTAILGEFFENREKIYCNAIEIVINAEPIPLGIDSYIPKYAVLNCSNVIIKTDYENKGIKVTVTNIDGQRQIDFLETIFYDLLDILFLVNGYFPYIEKQFIVIQDSKLEMFEKRNSLYLKGNSNFHWAKKIANIRNIDLNIVYTEYLKNKKANNLIVEVLCNVIHSHDIYVDIILTCVLQCIEGYMKSQHGQTKSSFADCLKAAIDYNDATKTIFRNGRICDLDDYVKKSKNFRNQFSHMDPKDDDDVFTDALEIYEAKERYCLLLRIIVLYDIGIKVKRESIKRYVEKMDSIELI